MSYENGGPAPIPPTATWFEVGQRVRLRSTAPEFASIGHLPGVCTATDADFVWYQPDVPYCGLQTMRVRHSAMEAEPAPEPRMRVLTFDEGGAHDMGDLDVVELHNFLGGML